jgi:YVTN family beta-propeller protein
VANAGAPSVSRIDPVTNRVVATIPIGPKRACCSEHIGMTAVAGAVWAAVPNGNTIVRIDPATNTVLATVQVPSGPCAYMAVDDASVWSASGGCADVLMRIDAHTNKLDPNTVAEAHPIGLALEAGSLWVVSLGSRALDRVDPRTGTIVARLPLGGTPIRAAAGFGSVWVRDDVGAVLRIQPAG